MKLSVPITNSCFSRGGLKSFENDQTEVKNSCICIVDLITHEHKKLVFLRKDTQMNTAEQIKDEIISKARSDAEFRSRLLANPRAAAGEVVDGPVPDAMSVSVHEESMTDYHLVLPPTGRLSEAQLVNVAGSRANQSGGSWGNDW